MPAFLGTLSILVKFLFFVIRVFAWVARFAKGRLEQEFYAFRVLKKWELVKLNPSFKSIYFHSVFQFSKSKSKSLIQLFALKEVENAFRQQLENHYSNGTFKTAIIGNLHTNPNVRQLKLEDVDVEEEINEFAVVFMAVTNQSRTPPEIEQFKLIEQTRDGIDRISEAVNPSEYPVLIDSYVNRPEEEKILWNRIKGQKAILLTGISFCGKSQLAKRIAERLTNEEGYQYSSRSDVNEAERYLRSEGSKPRVYLLEDPFGHNFESEIRDNWRRVSELLRNISGHNKLIITSRIEVLKSVTNSKNLHECSIEGLHWIDLTNRNKNFLAEVWNNLCLKEHVPAEVSDLIKNYLLGLTENEDNLIQVGQLTHLARMPAQHLIGKPIDALVHLASADSKEIGLEIKNRGMDSYRLFLSLGLTTTTNQSVTLSDIVFMLGVEDINPSYLKKTDDLSLHSFMAETEAEVKVVFPSYPSGLELSDKAKSELGFIQSRGFIELSNSNLWFNHPTYREAARYLLFSSGIDHLEVICALFAKALSCLSYENAINAANQLKFVNLNSSDETLKKRLTSLAIEANERSIFPGVRDICFSFLLEVLSDLPIEKQETLLHQLKIKFSTSSIRWTNEVPFIDPSHTSIFDNYRLETIKVDDVEKVIAKLDSGEQVAISKIWYLLKSYEWKEHELFPQTKGMLQILNCNEGFIRGKASYLIMCRSFPDSKVIDTIFSDEHPSVVFEGMKGAIIGFPDYSGDESKKVLQILLKALENNHVVIRANNLFSTFGVEYGSESIYWPNIPDDKKPVMWSLWAELFPIFLNRFPRNLRFANSGRFGATLDHSLKFLDPSQGLKICEAFYGWIEEYLHFSLPDTYEFGVLSYLLEVTQERKDVRFDLFQRIFSHPDTNFVTYSLSSSIGYWSSLTEKEIHAILSLLGSDRMDLRWLKAVALTQVTVPSEIQELLLGSPAYFEQDEKAIVESFDPKLLEDCLSVFFGHPQPLWWLGIHHNGRESWNKIMKWILKNEYKIGFDICLREMIGNGVNGFSREWQDASEIWEGLCNNSLNKKRLVNRLIIETSICTCSEISTKMLWQELINSYGNSPDDLVDQIVENIDALQSTNPEDLAEFLGLKFIETHLLKRLEVDYLIINTLMLVKNEILVSEKDLEMVVEDIVNTCSVIPPKLDLTFRIIQKVTKSKNVEFPSLKRLKNIPKNVGLNWQELQAKMDENYELGNWNSVAKKSVS